MLPGLVSILMPAYNGEVYIQQAIESVTAQTYPNWELIVVDDGSTDNTAKILAAYKDPRIQYTYQENRGQAAALNRGLDLAQGEYITTLDTDDWYSPNSLLDRASFLDKNSEFGVVYGDGYYCDVTGKVLQRFSQYRIGNIDGDVYDILIATPFFGTGGNVMVRREVFETYQIRYDESIVWCQDYDIYIRIAEKAAFGVVDTVTIWYRLHEANMTMAMPRGRRLESLIRTKFKVLASPRFEATPTPHKIEFFYKLLAQDLQGRLEDQTTVIEHTQFRTLPKKQQARLMRLVANDYLLRGEHVEFARSCLRKAGALVPYDPKTASSAMVAYLPPTITKFALQWRRKMNLQKKDTDHSPFEMITGTSPKGERAH